MPLAPGMQLCRLVRAREDVSRSPQAIRQRQCPLQRVNGERQTITGPLLALHCRAGQVCHDPGTRRPHRSPSGKAARAPGSRQWRHRTCGAAAGATRRSACGATTAPRGHGQSVPARERFSDQQPEDGRAVIAAALGWGGAMLRQALPRAGTGRRCERMRADAHDSVRPGQPAATSGARKKETSRRGPPGRTLGHRKRVREGQPRFSRARR
jgi:hypothetical protein